MTRRSPASTTYRLMHNGRPLLRWWIPVRIASKLEKLDSETLEIVQAYIRTELKEALRRIETYIDALTDNTEGTAPLKR